MLFKNVPVFVKEWGAAGSRSRGERREERDGDGGDAGAGGSRKRGWAGAGRAGGGACGATLLPTPYAPPHPHSLLGKSILGAGKGLVPGRAARRGPRVPSPLPVATWGHRGQAAPGAPSSRPPCGLWVYAGAAGRCFPLPFPEEGFPPGPWPGALRGLPTAVGLACVARRSGQGKARGQRPHLSRSFQRHGGPAPPPVRKVPLLLS